MNRPFDAVMRQAQSLVRSNRLAEATAVIQAALSGKAAPDVGHGERQEVHGGPEIELEAERKAQPSGEGGRQRTAAGAGDRRFSGPGAAAAPDRGGVHPRFGERFGFKTGKRNGPQGTSGLAREHRAGIAEGARFLALEHSGRHGSRPYKLYVPAALPAGPRPLVVMLHGCTQDPDDFAAGTRMNALAEEHGLLVAYPGQVRSANGQGCWNWFRPADQERGSGEPAIIAGIVADVARDFDVDPVRVFVAGLSAGGAMAAILGEAYPDLFAAIGVHSGLPSGSARDVMSALEAMRSGGKAQARGVSAGRLPRTIVFHGDKDRTVHPSNGERVALRGRSAGNAVRPAVKDGRIAGRAYRRTSLAATDEAPEVEFWQVQGLAHAWSGGSPDGSYADPRGPDASREMLRFFLKGTR